MTFRIYDRKKMLEAVKKLIPPETKKWLDEVVRPAFIKAVGTPTAEQATADEQPSAIEPGGE